jgi:hypothetical protein
MMLGQTHSRLKGIQTAAVMAATKAATAAVIAASTAATAAIIAASTAATAASPAAVSMLLLLLLGPPAGHARGSSVVC